MAERPPFRTSDLGRLVAAGQIRLLWQISLGAAVQTAEVACTITVNTRALKRQKEPSIWTAIRKQNSRSSDNLHWPRICWWCDHGNCRTVVRQFGHVAGQFHRALAPLGGGHAAADDPTDLPVISISAVFTACIRLPDQSGSSPMHVPPEEFEPGERKVPIEMLIYQ